jgi:hypothetical protein
MVAFLLHLVWIPPLLTRSDGLLLKSNGSWYTILAIPRLYWIYWWYIHQNTRPKTIWLIKVGLMGEEDFLFEQHSGPRPLRVIHIFGHWIPRVLPQCHYLATIGHPQTLTTILCAHGWVFWELVKWSCLYGRRYVHHVSHWMTWVGTRSWSWCYECI